MEFGNKQLSYVMLCYMLLAMLGLFGSYSTMSILLHFGLGWSSLVFLETILNFVDPCLLLSSGLYVGVSMSMVGLYFQGLLVDSPLSNWASISLEILF